MPSAGWALQQAIFQALAADSAVVNALGGTKIYDIPPAGASLPYVVFAASTLRDWSAGGEEGHEHLVTLHTWSEAPGARETHEILSALRRALHEKALSLAGHHLVSLRYEYSEARRDSSGELCHGLIRYRALTEPLP